MTLIRRPHEGGAYWQQDGTFTEGVTIADALRLTGADAGGWARICGGSAGFGIRDNSNSNNQVYFANATGAAIFRDSVTVGGDGTFSGDLTVGTATEGSGMIVSGLPQIQALKKYSTGGNYATGVFGFVEQDAANAYGTKGVHGTVHITNAAGTVALATGVHGQTHIANTGGTVTLATGVLGGVQQTGAGGTITTAVAFYADGAFSSAGTLTTAYGLYVASQTAGANNYAIYTNAGLVRFGGPLVVDAGIALVTSTKTTTYTLLATDHTVLCDATSAGFTVSLPATPTPTGRVYQVKKIDATVNAVTVSGNGNTIDGVATFVLATQYECVTFQWDGTTWWVT